MQTRAFKNFLVAVTILTLLLTAFAIRQANAVIIFELKADCGSCAAPFDITGDVTGTLTLDDSVLDMAGNIPALGIFDAAQIITMELFFDFVGPTPPGFNPFTFANPLPIAILGFVDPVGQFNADGDGIRMLAIANQAGNSFFQVDRTSETQATWQLLSNPGGGGNVDTFDIPSIPEPDTAILFMLAALWLAFVTRRRTILAAIVPVR